MNLTPYLKSVFGFITPGAVILGSAVTAASDGGSTITQAEWVTAIVACVVTGSLVFGVPNRDPDGRHQDESTMPPERGAGELRVAVYILGIIALVLLIVALLNGGIDIR